MEREMLVDFGKGADDYALHRRGFSTSIMQRLNSLGVGLAGQKVLDLGTGTGAFAIEFAKSGCDVTGIDPSSSLLKKGKAAVAREGLSVQFVQGFAENTRLPSEAFDVVTAATSWHWFDQHAAAEESRRVLRPGGILVLATLEWHCLPGNLLTKTLELVRRYIPKSAIYKPSTLRYPDWTEELVRAGFTGWEVFAYIEAVQYTHEGWRGRVRASQGMAPAMDSKTLVECDAALAAMLVHDFPQQPMEVAHRIAAIVARLD